LGPLVKRAIEANPQILDKHQITLGKFHGAGYAGCVYQYDENSVIKFTTSIDEVVLANFLLNQEEGESTNGFPEIYAVFPIIIPKFKAIYAIIKEDIPTTIIPSEYVELANYLCDQVNPEDDPYITEETLLVAVEYLSEGPLLPEASEMFYRFVYFLIWCAYHQIYIYDVIDNNLGIRNRNGNLTLVVRDFSACQAL